MASHIHIESENCKGCGLCILACPSKQLSVSGKLNKSGYIYIEAANAACAGCAFCYHTCPEPGAITVYKGGGV